VAVLSIAADSPLPASPTRADELAHPRFQPIMALNAKDGPYDASFIFTSLVLLILEVALLLSPPPHKFYALYFRFPSSTVSDTLMYPFLLALCLPCVEGGHRNCDCDLKPVSEPVTDSESTNLADAARAEASLELLQARAHTMKERMDGPRNAFLLYPSLVPSECYLRGN